MKAALLVILAASAVGVVVSAALWIECAATLRAAVRSAASDRDLLVDKASDDLTLESVRLLVLLVFLGAAILSMVTGPSPLRGQIIVWGLVSVPVLVTGSGLRAWIVRRRLRHELLEGSPVGDE